MSNRGTCGTRQHFDVRKEYEAGIPASYPRPRSDQPPAQHVLRNLSPLPPARLCQRRLRVADRDGRCVEWKLSESKGVGVSARRVGSQEKGPRIDRVGTYCPASLTAPEAFDLRRWRWVRLA